jgi:hypothetical protein
MNRYEYKVIAAPTKGQKAAGAKTVEARFAYAVECLMNELAAEGWAYLRSDLLPSEERQGLTSSQIVYRSVLVFQREKRPASGDAAKSDQLGSMRKEPSVSLSSGPASAAESLLPEPAEPAQGHATPVNDEPHDPHVPR